MVPLPASLTPVILPPSPSIIMKLTDRPSPVPLPGILALMHRYNADSRDGGRSERMALGHSEEGFWGCTAVTYCSEVCPKDVDPANAINQNKMGSAIDYFLRFVAPRGAGK